MPLSIRTLAPLLMTAFALAGCGGMPSNRSLDSLHQPVVERSTYTLDLVTGPGGLAPGEDQRLAGWFEALAVRFGDRVAIDDPVGDPATASTVAALASRRGVLLAEAAPVTAGALPPGSARVVINRSRARVPGCPDWSARSDVNLGNATYPNYGCAVNANLAAMVADPEHLLSGADNSGGTVGMTATKAIESYRQAPPSGQQGLKDAPTQSEGGGS